MFGKKKKTNLFLYVSIKYFYFSIKYQRSNIEVVLCSPRGNAELYHACLIYAGHENLLYWFRP